MMRIVAEAVVIIYNQGLADDTSNTHGNVNHVNCAEHYIAMHDPRVRVSATYFLHLIWWHSVKKLGEIQFRRSGKCRKLASDYSFRDCGTGTRLRRIHLPLNDVEDGNVASLFRAGRHHDVLRLGQSSHHIQHRRATNRACLPTKIHFLKGRVNIA